MDGIDIISATFAFFGGIVLFLIGLVLLIAVFIWLIETLQEALVFFYGIIMIVLIASNFQGNFAYLGLQTLGAIGIGLVLWLLVKETKV